MAQTPRGAGRSRRRTGRAWGVRLVLVLLGLGLGAAASTAATSLTFKGGSIVPTSVGPSGSYKINCDYGQLVDCIGPVPPSGSCAWVGWSGTVAQFSCTAGTTPGTFSGACQTVTGTASNCARGRIASGR
ncbi:MAG: hypothetical protein HYZ92_06980 [Candidatus Omnitrophica bacterium]|nr:hypothetical protein [Candidatus Omnitrophota bacterium]